MSRCFQRLVARHSPVASGILSEPRSGTPLGEMAENFEKMQKIMWSLSWFNSGLILDVISSLTNLTK